MGEINQKQFSPARVMSVQSEVSTPMTRRSETWPDEKESSASSDQSAAAPPRMQLIKVLISIVLLVGVVALVGMFYGISEVVDEVRALSVAMLSAVLIALLANALAAVLRFKIIATEIEYPVTIRRAVAAVSARSLAGALFFQIAGQLMVRGYIAGREGMPFAAVVVCISACDGHVGHSDLCPWRRAADRRFGGHHGCTFFAGSRSGWIAATFVLLVACYLQATNARKILLSIAFAGILSAALTAVGSDLPLPVVLPTVSSTQERLVSIIGGLNLFWDLPVFGAGLGAFRNQMILTLDWLPLVIHSIAVWLLAELGIVGFLIFAVSFTHIFFKEWKSASAFIVLCLGGFAVMSGPGDMLYQRTFWLLIGAALAVRQPPSNQPN
jgi:O-Antigen ligase